MIVKTFKYRLYPTKSQRTLLQGWLDRCRWVYNKTLEVRKHSWEDKQQSLRLFEANKLLTKWKRENPWLKEAHSQALQNAQHRVDVAFQAFFRRAKSGEKPGYPRFRGKFRYDSFALPQYPGGAKLQGSVLRIRKIGDIRLNLHRSVQGEIKTTTVRKTSTGKWFVSFSVTVDAHPLPVSEQAIGIDLGLESFATNDRGVKIPNPRFFRSDEKALVQVQRGFSKTKKGSKERRFRRKAVARVHERIRNRRANFAHQLSRYLVNKYDIVIFEDLKPSKMVHNRKLSKSISDAAWTQLVHYTTYKAEEAGRNCVLVNPAYTSQDCSRCGHRKKKSLSQRIHECPVCGFVLDRDHNAALNILRLGLQSLGNSP